MCVPRYSGLICKQSLAVSYRVCPGYSGLICKQSLAVSYHVCPGYNGLICKQSLAVSYRVCPGYSGLICKQSLVDHHPNDASSINFLPRAKYPNATQLQHCQETPQMHAESHAPGCGCLSPDNAPEVEPLQSYILCNCPRLPWLLMTKHLPLTLGPG